MDADVLTTRLVRSKAPPPTAKQLEMLLALCKVYEDAGVLSGDPLPALHRVCPHAGECWKGVEGKRAHGVGAFDADSEKGCMLLPWVGPAYRPGGVAVLGMNLRYAGGDWELAMEHRIAVEPGCGQEAKLRSQGGRAHRSYWSKGTMRDVAAVLRSTRGAPLLDTKDPNELADALLASARLQAVKCSPIGGRSSPEPAMSERCPQQFLRAELGVLKPSVLLAYGGPAHGAVHQAGNVTINEKITRFRRGTLALSGGTSIDVLLLTHPAHGGWHQAHRELVVSLTTRPIPPT